MSELSSVRRLSRVSSREEKSTLIQCQLRRYDAASSEEGKGLVNKPSG